MKTVVTDAEIVAAYAKTEVAHGGPRKADAAGVLREVAALLGVSYERARAAILIEWGAAG